MASAGLMIPFQKHLCLTILDPRGTKNLSNGFAALFAIPPCDQAFISLPTHNSSFLLRLLNLFTPSPPALDVDTFLKITYVSHSFSSEVKRKQVTGVIFYEQVDISTSQTSFKTFGAAVPHTVSWEVMS